METLFVISYWLLMLALAAMVLWLYFVLPAGMAERRGRSAVAWVLVSLFFSPFLAIFLLALLGGVDKQDDQEMA